MTHVLFFGSVIVLAYLFAKVEIEIEGGAGWAANLPTWRLQNRWTDLVYGGRPLTGYHLWVQSFVLAFMHMPYAVGLPWSWANEGKIVAFMVLFWIAEDFLWFVVNPAFGIRKFRYEHIWWHQKSWWGIAPREYFVAGTLAIALYVWAISRP